MPWIAFLIGIVSCDPGFILGKVKDRNILFHVVYSHKTRFCDHLRMTNVDGDSSVDFKLQDEFYNNRPSFRSTDGYRFLSFVSNMEHGTWLLGDRPGVDTGIHYGRDPRPTFSPLDVTSSWFRLRKDGWEEDSKTRLECVTDSFEMNWMWTERVLKPGKKQTRILIKGVEGCSADSFPYPHAYNLLGEPSRNKMKVMELKLLENMPLGRFVKVGGKSYLFRNAEFLENGWRLALYHLESGEDSYLMTSKSGFTNYTTGAAVDSQLVSPNWKPFQQLVLGDYAQIYTDTDHFFGRLIFAKDGKQTFRIWPSHRRELMEQTLLSSLKDTVVVDSESQTVSQDGKRVEFFSVVPLGKDLLRFIRDHISTNEGLWDLSSCFTYHAATTIPEQLVYAAELICFAMGYKPVVMVQMTTDSDEQGKFPLVSELISALILYSNNVDASVKYTINRFRDFETLIFFQESHQFVVDNLVPVGEAQALHIVPFPGEDTNENKRVYQEQVVNSYWNGVMLGYPRQFVDSYCTDLIAEEHQDRRTTDTNKAKAREMVQEWQKGGRELPRIGEGSANDFYDDFAAFFDTVHF